VIPLHLAAATSFPRRFIIDDSPDDDHAKGEPAKSKQSKLFHVFANPIFPNRLPIQSYQINKGPNDVGRISVRLRRSRIRFVSFSTAMVDIRLRLPIQVLLAGAPLIGSGGMQRSRS
jgi:hypothetical protein